MSPLAKALVHWPHNGNRMLKAVCGVVAMTLKKATSPEGVTCPKCLALLKKESPRP